MKKIPKGDIEWMEDAKEKTVKVMVLRSNIFFNGVKNPQEARKHLYRELDDLAKIAARHDAKGIKIKLKEIVPEFTPQENESVL